MTPTPTDTPSAGAMRAAEAVCEHYDMLDDAIEQTARIIDRESGLRECVAALELAVQYVEISKQDRRVMNAALSRTKGGE